MRTMNRGVIVGIVGVVVAMGSAWRPTVAQTARNEDVLPALLTEVRGLRSAIEQLAGAGPRVQLLSSRLQLQEGRMTAMIRRLDTVRDNLATAKRELDRARGVEKMFAGEGGKPGATEDNGVLAGFKREVVAAQASVDRLIAEEAQLTQDLTVEQARWTDINRRLDELERALAGKAGQ
jgi:hypothetical protein